MNNFEFKNPTKIIFGKGEISKITKEIPLTEKVLVLYGGGSIKKNGIYEQVKIALEGYDWEEFGGIPSNPEFEVLVEALKVIKEKNITFLLAVGGGSVIDGVKFLATASFYKGNPIEILEKSIRTEQGNSMPFGTILTMPATGSEMNSGCVISIKSTHEKIGIGGPGLFPQFSILDPEVVKSIPKNQLVNGIIDSYTHVLEQYMTYKTQATLQDRFCESILQTIHEITPKLIHEEYNYEIAANYMWCCTLALNGLIQKGVPTDWGIHMIGHELTAYYGIDHAKTLAILAPNLYTFFIEEKKEKLAQYAERIFGIKNGSDYEKAELAIQNLKNFFHSLEVKTKLSEYTKDFENTGDIIEKVFTKRKWLKIGDRGMITPEIAKKIVEMAY